MLLSDVCLSVAYIGPKSRTERPRKTKIGTQVAHVTRDSGATFKVKWSKVKVTRPICSPPCWRVRRLQRWAWERVGRGKLLLRCSLLGGGEGRGHTVTAVRLQLVFKRNFYKSTENAGPGKWKTWRNDGPNGDCGIRPIMASGALIGWGIRCPDKMPLDKMPPAKMPPTVEFVFLFFKISAKFYSKYKTPTQYL